MICFERELSDVYKGDESSRHDAVNISVTRVDSERKFVFREDDE
jgi:hypothetical protein